MLTTQSNGHMYMCTLINAYIPTTIEWSYGSQSLVKLVAKVHSVEFMDYGKVHSIVNGIETVSSRPMAVCRPMDCACICKTSNFNSGDLYHL